MPPDARLLVGIPTMGSIHPTLTARLILWARRYPNIHFYFAYHVAPVDRARNQIVKQFLELRVGEAKEPLTHLLFIDSDTIPPVDAIDRLFSHDKDIVSGLTPIASFDNEEKAWTTYDNCFAKVENRGTPDVKTYIVGRNTGFQEIFRCGASCLLISRRVFEELAPPYFLFVPNDENTLHVKSEDIYFCDTAREAGYRIFADTDVVCEHYKSIML